MFTLEQILKQIDLNGGMLKYEGICILNNAEAASFHRIGIKYKNQLLCTPASPFGEAIEFDYSKAMHLIIDAFGLLDVGKYRAINLAASIDAAH